jgi:mycothiol synthase
MSEITLIPLDRSHAVEVRELINRSDAHDGIPRLMSQEEFDEAFDEPYFDPALHARVAFLGGQFAGWTRIWHRPSGEGLERAHVMGVVDPELRGKGVGRALLGWGTTVATEILEAIDNDLDKFVRVTAFDFIESAHRLYRRAGYEPARWFEEMLRPLDEIPEPVVPAGIRILPFPLDRTEEVRVSKNLAFVDHWGSTAVDVISWAEFTSGHGSRIDKSFVAEDIASGRMVAHCLNDCYPEEESSSVGATSSSTTSARFANGVARASPVRCCIPRCEPSLPRAARTP